MATEDTPDRTRDVARQRLKDAEAAYNSARSEHYVARDIRDSRMGEAHQAGLSSREISDLVGDIGQPNVVRARRRAFTRRDVVPDGLLSPVDALRRSEMNPKEFMTAVRSGRLQPVDLPGGVRAFREEDIEHLRPTAS